MDPPCNIDWYINGISLVGKGFGDLIESSVWIK